MRAVTCGMTECSCSLSLWSLTCKTITKALSLSLPLLLAFHSLAHSAESFLSADYVINKCATRAAGVKHNTFPAERDEAKWSGAAVQQILFIQVTCKKTPKTNTYRCCGDSLKG